jgi:diaminohydroxyphosphoribosylaminopyrimidine deaminase / 5-amino-6-(5-phosphoribosylamino)uracil reductase
VTTAAESADWRSGLEDVGVEVVVVKGDDRGRTDLGSALRSLRVRGIGSVLVEGGPTLAGALLGEHLVDRLVLHLAPVLLGSEGVPVVQAPDVPTMSEAWRWEIAAVGEIGPDIEIVARPRRTDAA